MTQLKLYLVIAVDPYWGGKQHSGRFYKYGITSKQNVLDRHPSYTEVLFEHSLAENIGRWTEGKIKQVLNIWRRGNEFSSEAISCDRIGADAMRVLVEGVMWSEYRDYVNSYPCFDHLRAFGTLLNLPMKRNAEFENKFYEPLMLKKEMAGFSDEHALAYSWAERFVNARNDWSAFYQNQSQVKPMW